MPLYEYHCRKCNQDVEVLVRNSSEEQPECPACGAKQLERLLSVAAAPAVSGKSLPVAQPSTGGGCGRPQCGSGCMFE